ncbi:MAG: hypothetical protein ABIW76_04595 [Fibrobacteria bacterium]
MEMNGALKTTVIYSIAILSTWLVGCTSYTKTHVIKWSGVFMVDSVTAGAVRLEYHQETSNNNTYAGGRTYDINQRLYFYNFKSDSLYLFSTLNNNLSGIPFSISYFKDIDFNYPMLMYITTLNGNTITSVYNIETKEFVFSTPFRGFLSSSSKYLVGVKQVMNLSTKDTSRVENTANDNMFYFNDTTEMGYGIASSLRNPPFPIYKYGLSGVLPESLGVINIFDVFGRSPLNKGLIIRLLDPASLRLLNLDSLKNKSIISELVSSDDAFVNADGFDYSKHSGNFVLFKNVGQGGSETGVFVGNLNDKISMKNISPTIYEDD